MLEMSYTYSPSVSGTLGTDLLFQYLNLFYTLYIYSFFRVFSTSTLTCTFQRLWTRFYVVQYQKIETAFISNLWFQSRNSFLFFRPLKCMKKTMILSPLTLFLTFFSPITNWNRKFFELWHMDAYCCKNCCMISKKSCNDWRYI